MHPKIRKSLDFVVGLAVLGTMTAGAGAIIAGAGGLFYQSCLKKETLTDVIVTDKVGEWLTVNEERDESYFVTIKVDKYKEYLRMGDQRELNIGDKLKTLTYRHNILFKGIILEYEKAQDYD